MDRNQTAEQDHDWDFLRDLAEAGSKDAARRMIAAAERYAAEPRWAARHAITPEWVANMRLRYTL